MPEERMAYFMTPMDENDPNLLTSLSRDARIMARKMRGCVRTSRAIHVCPSRFYFNITTLEGFEFCIEFNVYGYRVIGTTHNQNNLVNDNYYFTLHGLLLDISPTFTQLFGSQAVVNIVRPYVRHVSVMAEEDTAIFFNLTTVEGTEMCLELSGKGCRIVGEAHNDRSLNNQDYADDILVTLEEESEFFRENYKNRTPWNGEDVLDGAPDSHVLDGAPDSHVLDGAPDSHVVLVQRNSLREMNGDAWPEEQARAVYEARGRGRGGGRREAQTRGADERRGNVVGGAGPEAQARGVDGTRGNVMPGEGEVSNVGVQPRSGTGAVRPSPSTGAIPKGTGS